jgi:hypothetical protein
MSFPRGDFVGSASIGAGLASVLEIVPASAESIPTASQGTKIINLDDRVSFKQQLERNVGPVVLTSTFLVHLHFKLLRTNVTLCDSYE